MEFIPLSVGDQRDKVPEIWVGLVWQSNFQ